MWNNSRNLKKNSESSDNASQGEYPRGEILKNFWLDDLLPERHEEQKVDSSHDKQYLHHIVKKVAKHINLWKFSFDAFAELK